MQKRRLVRFIRVILFMALFVVGMSLNKNYVQAADGSIKALTVVNGDEQFTSENTYTGKTISTQDGYSQLSIVEVKTDYAGLVSFAYQGSNTDVVDFTLFSNEALTEQVNYTNLSGSTETQVTDGMAVPKAGTYYLAIQSFNSESFDFTISADVYSSEDSTLTNKSAKCVSLQDSQDSNYYKFTLNKTAAIKVYGSYANGEECYANIDICNSSKKVITGGSATPDGFAAALAKGTYYLKLSNGSTDYYAIGYELLSITDKSGAKKASAASLKVGKKTSGIVLASDKTSKEDWYKIKTTKTKKTTITFTGEATGMVSLDFYDASGYFYGSLYISDFNKEDSASPYVGDNGTLPPGTYYMKVTKYSKDVSGYYSIIVKQ